MRARRPWAWMAALLSALGAGAAHAQPATELPKDAGHSPPPEPIVSAPRGPAPPAHVGEPEPRTDIPFGDKRPPQSYGGKPHKTTVGEALLWIPRILFFPVHVVTEYVIRQPLGALVSFVEGNPALSDFLITPAQVGVTPSAFIDFGFRPSVGIYFFYDDFLAKYNALRASIATGGARYLKASVVDRIPIAVRADGYVESYVQAELDAAARPDLEYWGIGPSTHFGDAGQYELRTVGGGARIHLGLLGASFLETWVNARDMRFGDGICDRVPLPTHPAIVTCETPTLLSQVAAGKYRLPPGLSTPDFLRGYALIKVGARFSFDTRKPLPEPGSGIVVEAHVEQGTVLSGTQHGSYYAFGGTAGGFIDLTGTRRVLGLILDARVKDPVGPTFQIPFTELIGNKRVDYVPEDDLIRGFLPGRLLGATSVVASLNYEWPIWAYLDGTMQLAVGDVFGHHFEDFKPELLRLSFVGGFTSPNRRDHQFNLQLGFGTKTFAEGASPESLRFLLGGTTGF